MATRHLLLFGKNCKGTFRNTKLAYEFYKKGTYRLFQNDEKKVQKIKLYD